MAMPRPRETFKGWRSGLEEEVGKNLTSRGVRFVFEGRKIKYTPPLKEHTYTCDFELENGVLIETKGYFTSEDRKKMRWVKEQHPELDIRMLFGNSRNRINKGSPTTYAMWCEKNGYLYADKVVPQEWIDAPRKN
jgi:hypothetical protein